MNQLSLEATVRASDHLPAVRSANLNVAVASRCSSQLRMTPLSDTLRLGCADWPVAGTASGSTVTGQAASFGDSVFCPAGCSAREQPARMAAPANNTATMEFRNGVSIQPSIAPS